MLTLCIKITLLFFFTFLEAWHIQNNYGIYIFISANLYAQFHYNFYNNKICYFKIVWIKFILRQKLNNVCKFWIKAYHGISCILEAGVLILSCRLMFFWIVNCKYAVHIRDLHLGYIQSEAKNSILSQSKFGKIIFIDPK